MIKNIPVIFFHLGEQDYFHSTLHLASKKNDVIVIGNQTHSFTKEHPNVKFENYENYASDVEKFKNTYVHLHTSHPDMQVICYLRWLIIRNYCIEKAITNIFHADSDLAILSNLTDVYYENINHDWALATMFNQHKHRLVASAHVSYWNINVLSNFCNFIFSSYADDDIKSKIVEKYIWHKETNSPGGVCDMTQLYLFSQQTPHVSLTKTINKSCFDDNVNSSENYYIDEYHVEHEMKKILVNKDQFYFLSNKEGPILAHVIHCQGVAKNLLNSIWKHVKGFK